MGILKSLMMNFPLHIKRKRTCVVVKANIILKWMMKIRPSLNKREDLSMRKMKTTMKMMIPKEDLE